MMARIRILLITALLAVTALPVWAQMGEQRHNFSVGVSGGMNYNTVTFQPTVKQKGMMGINGGLTARYISEKYFSMICGAQVEINYSQLGWDEKFEENGVVINDRSYKRAMNYVQIPFLAHLAFGKEQRGMQFFLNLGPQIGFLLGDSEEFGGNWTDDQKKARPEYGKKINNKFDYGITGGAGLELRTKAGNFLIEGRYYFGLADIYNSTKKDDFSRSANSTISGRITYMFDIFK